MQIMLEMTRKTREEKIHIKIAAITTYQVAIKRLL